MSTRRSSQDRRCPECKVNLIYCFCDGLLKYNNRTKISVIMHKRELFLTSNTVNLARQTFDNFNLFIRGTEEKLTSQFVTPKNHIPLYLYPSEDAIELNQLNLEATKTYNLIVPDGSWRQAKKIHRREPLLENIQRVKITNIDKSKYSLRKQKYEYGLCTFEAIMHALKVIEPETPFEKLESNFQTMVQAHIYARKK